MDKIIKKILKKLDSAGYEAFIVGGYVRDSILKIETNDIDICTNALPMDIIEIFKLDKKIQINYGCINIKTKKYNIDITTFRKESDYKNHLPKKHEYINDLKIDLKRRDFTCNSLIMNYNGKIIDYYNGIKDINDKIIRCIGNVNKKLTEDPLRILRAIRLSIIYDFSIDQEILDFIINNKELIRDISYTRKKEELDKILSSKNKIKGLELIKELDLLEVLDIDYDKIKYTNDILGIYSQINLSHKYPLTKYEKSIINDVKELLNLKTINNHTLYKYGLYINTIAGEILGIDIKKINKMFDLLPIKERNDIKINIKTLVKLNDNCYNKINEIYVLLEKNILDNKLKNKTKDIIDFLRK